MEKVKIRQQVLSCLKELAKDTKQKTHKEKIIRELFFLSDYWKQAKSIGITLSMPFEYNTQRIIEEAWKEEKAVYIPRVCGKHRMTFHPFTNDSRLTISSYGIREPVGDEVIDPVEMDLLVVPGVAFSHNGYRVGHGGGYYDYLLADYSGNTCALVFNEQLCDDWQPDKFDLPVQKIFSDEEVISHYE